MKCSLGISNFLEEVSIGDSKGIFHAKMGQIKDRNGMDLTKEEDMKKRWQEYTDELHQKVFMTQLTMTM